MKLSFEEIKSRFDAESAARSVVTSADQIPMAYELLSNEWFTDVRCKKQPGTKVSNWRLGDEDEGTSSRRRIFLEYNKADSGLPESVFCKSTFTLASRCLLGMNGAIEGEVNFYNIIRSQLDLEAPKGLFSNFNPETLNSIVMLEDMSNDVTFCDHRTVVTEKMALEQVSLLAKLHGKYYESDAFKGELSYLNTWEDFFTITANEAGFGPQADIGFKEAREVIPERLFKQAEKVWPATLQSVARHAQLPHTLVHSDVHLKNWYITADNHMGLSDWQCMCVGHWSRDIAYALSTGLATADRRAWEKDLIIHYLAELKANGGPETPFDEAWTQYRQQLFGALAWWTPVLSPNPDVPDMQPRDTSLEFISRMTHAIDDLDSLNSF